MEKLAIIPARGGSKRIPNKNIKTFLGKPIIAYSIETALASNLFSEVMVSTEDEEIARISQKYGAKIPFMRSIENADDFVGLAEVIFEVINEYDKRGRVFDLVCCILPTAPLISISRLKEGLKLLESNSYPSVTPVVPFSYPILRSVKFNDNNELIMNWPEYYDSRSQDLPSAYHDCGLFYWLKYENFIKEKKLFLTKGTGLILDEIEVQDIDTESDWLLAEMKYNILNQKI